MPGKTGACLSETQVINLANLQCDFFELTDVKGGETFRRIPVQPNDLMLGDQAYGNPPGVRYVVRKGGHVLVHLTVKPLLLFAKSGKKISLLKHLHTLQVGRIGEWAAWVQSDEGLIAGRLIAVKLGQQAAQKDRARVRRRAQRKQQEVSADSLTAAGYVFVWTTVLKAIANSKEVTAVPLEVEQ